MKKPKAKQYRVISAFDFRGKRRNVGDIMIIVDSKVAPLIQNKNIEEYVDTVPSESTNGNLSSPVGDLPSPAGDSSSPVEAKVSESSLSTKMKYTVKEPFEIEGEMLEVGSVIEIEEELATSLGSAVEKVENNEEIV